MRTLRSRHRWRRGAAAVEFGLTLPFIMFIFIAALEYGWLYTQMMWLNNVVRDVARYSMNLNQSEVDVPTTAQDRIRMLLEGNFNYNCAAQCTINAQLMPGGYAGTYDVLQLEAEVQYQSFANLVPVPAQLHAEMTVLMMEVVD